MFETDTKLNKTKLKRTKFNWGMNIVKDIVKSNLVLSVQTDASIHANNNKQATEECTKEAYKPSSNQTESRCAVKNKHSIMITVNNEDFDEETRSKRLRTANSSRLETVDSRLVITASENERIVIQNEVKSQLEDENDLDIEIIEVVEPAQIESKENVSENQVDSKKESENTKSPTKEDKQEISIQEAIDDLFKKTTSKPHIYWAPVITYRVPKWYKNFNKI